MAGEPMVLCRPSSGLYDIFCQIDRVCHYAERVGRIAIIDTNFHATKFFRDDFSNYFVSLQPNLILSAARHASLFDACDVAPEIVRGRVNSYVAVFDREKGYVEQESREPLTFDFGRVYEQALLLHHAGGRTPGALAALGRMRLHDRLVDVLFDRLRAIGQPYSAIHIRDTDYRADYRPHIAGLMESIRGPLFLATDNRASVDFVRSSYRNGEVFSFADLPDEAGKPLHYLAAGEQGDLAAANADAVVDLMMLALANNLFYFPLQPNTFNAQFSGFSLIANELRKAPYILSRLIGRRDLEIEGWAPLIRNY